MGTSHLVQVRPRWDHSHQIHVRPRCRIRVTSLVRGPEWDQRSLVKVRPRCGIEYPGPNDAWVRTRVTRAMQAQMGNRITRSW